MIFLLDEENKETNMSNFKKIVNDVKYEERRLSGISYIPDSIFSIVEKYIDDSVKSVIIPDGENFIDNLDQLISSHSNTKFTVYFKNDKIYNSALEIKEYSNIEICRATLPLNLNSSYDLALSIPLFGMKGNYKAKGFSSNDLSCAFAEDLLNNINSNGKVIFIAPQGITFNEQTQAFRTNILNNYKLKTVSLFPNKLFALTNIQTVLFEIENGITTDIKLNEYELKNNNLTEINQITVSKEDVEKQGSLLIHPFLTQQDDIMKKYNSSSCEKKMLENVAKDLFRGKSDIKYTEDAGNIKVINIADVKEYYIDFSNLRSIYEDERKNLRYELQNGDILLTSRGTDIRTAVFEKPDNQMYVAAAGLIVIRSTDISMSKYLQMFFASEVGTKMLDSCKKGTAIINIVPADIKKLLIPILPSEKIIKLTEKHQEVMNKMEKAKQEAEKLINAQKQNINKFYESFLSEILQN